MKFSSALISAGSGSLGGIVASRNSFGQYLRRRAVPINPASGRQLVIRDALIAAVNNWTGVLTAPQRAAWAEYARNVPMTDALGNSINLGGQQMYIRSFVSGTQVGATLTSFATAPTVFDLGDFTTPVPTWTHTSGLSLAFTAGDPWAIASGGFMAMYMGLPQNPSRSFFKGPFRYIGKISGAVSPPTSPNVTAASALPWPIPAATAVWLGIRVIQPDGRLSSVRVIGPSTVGA